MLSLLDMGSKVYPRKYLGHPLKCWVGEFGYSTYVPLKDGLYAGFTEESQAAYLLRAAVLGLANGAEAWCVYDFVDDSPDPHDAESRFGLVADSSRQYQPKPAFYAFQRLARILGPDWQLAAAAPAQLDQSNLSPLRNNGDQWQAPASVGFVKIDAPMVRWFRVGADYVTILWRAGWRWNEFNPPQGKIVWADAPAGVTVAVQDLVSGAACPVSVVREGNTVTVADLPIGSSPIAIRWIGAAAITAPKQAAEVR
jgi:hypothetical protein